MRRMVKFNESNDVCARMQEEYLIGGVYITKESPR